MEELLQDFLSQLVNQSIRRFIHKWIKETYKVKVSDKEYIDEHVIDNHQRSITMIR